MLKTIEGVYRDGKVELVETPGNVFGDTRVIVTFLGSADVDLQARDIGQGQAADLRARLAAFADDWDSLEMKVYDNYDAAKAAL